LEKEDLSLRIASLRIADATKPGLRACSSRP